MRSKIILAAALAMGLVTTVLFFNYMKRYNETVAVSDSVVSVVAAKQAIKENTKISNGMLEVVQVPAKGLLPETVKNAAEAEGKIAAADLAPGEVLLAHHLKTQQDEALFVSKKVQDGYRAVSVGVNLVQSVSNLIEPDDYVDVISTPTDVKQGDHVVSAMILENVRVLAIGRRMVEAKTDTPYVEYSSVTLEVKPQDAVDLVNAGERGKIALMLHSRVVAEQAKK